MTDLDPIITLALRRAEERLSADRDVEVAARLLEAVAAVVAAQRAPQLAEARAEIREVREALRVREGTKTVEAAKSTHAANVELRRRLAEAGPCRKEPA
jgi:uncharacterized protein HemX